MGRHAEWRKVAKKERRKRVRIMQAKERDKLFSSEWYIKQQEIEEELIIEQINKQNDEENEKWIQAEKIAIAQWKKLQEEKERLKQKRLEQEAKLKLEWELEQKKKQIEEEKIKAAEEELKRKQDIFMNNLDLFLSGDSDEPPAELKVMHETRPDADLCPFFSKTACCRFGDQCSRNHQYPGISKVLLATNFYNHFGLSNANVNEYDTDIMLEFEDSDTYKEYKDFFFDVLSEFEKFGRITQFKASSYEGVVQRAVLVIFYMSSEIQIIYIMDIIRERMKLCKRRIGLHVHQCGHGGGLNHRKRMFLKELFQDDQKAATDDVEDLDTARIMISITDGLLLAEVIVAS